MYIITSPIKGLNAPSTFGPVTLEFVDSKATTDELSGGLLDYLQSTGYLVETDEEPKRADAKARKAATDKELL